jgi:pSer/pThr/pTyr-binding forkhead associated (FHA) protein
MPRTAAPFQPTFRPPVATLVVFDDGKTDGETLRLRDDRFVIGRSEGDLLLPHDGLVSARHLEITRQRAGDGWSWTVMDLDTTNGLFVRISRTILVDSAEILVGRGRYIFEASAVPATEPLNTLPQQAGASTRPWGAEAKGVRPAVLVEMVADEAAARFPLVGSEYWIGTDPSCTICRADDPFVEPRHVRLARAPGGWEARNNKSPNGLWLRVGQINVDGVCLFQIGEQRFRLTAGSDGR